MSSCRLVRVCPAAIISGSTHADGATRGGVSVNESRASVGVLGKVNLSERAHSSCLEFLGDGVRESHGASAGNSDAECRSESKGAVLVLDIADTADGWRGDWIDKDGLGAVLMLSWRDCRDCRDCARVGVGITGVRVLWDCISGSSVIVSVVDIGFLRVLLLFLRQYQIMKRRKRVTRTGRR